MADDEKEVTETKHDDLAFQTYLERVLHRLSVLQSGTVLSLGIIDARLDLFFVDLLSFRAIITGNRREHYLSNHPEIERFEHLVILAALRPEEIHVDPYRLDTFNHYVSIDNYHDVRVALRYSSRIDRQHSVITAMVTRKRDRKSSERRGNLVWRR